jgi:hypothetical protein
LNISNLQNKTELQVSIKPNWNPTEVQAFIPHILSSVLHRGYVTSLVLRCWDLLPHTLFCCPFIVMFWTFVLSAFCGKLFILVNCRVLILLLLSVPSVTDFHYLNLCYELIPLHETGVERSSKEFSLMLTCFCGFLQVMDEADRILNMDFEQEVIWHEHWVLSLWRMHFDMNTEY